MSSLHAPAGRIGHCTENNPTHKLPCRCLSSQTSRGKRTEGGVHPKAPWNPRSRTLSECRITMTMKMHCNTYGGAVNAFDTKTLKWNDLMTVGRSKRHWEILNATSPTCLQVESGFVGVKVMFDNSKCPHSPRSVAASLKSALVARFLQV
jgi:hypothetical protein